MKVLALERITQKTKEFELPMKKGETKPAIIDIFAKTNFDIILFKWKEKIMQLELVLDKTAFGGTRVRNPKLLDYTKTELGYHPLAKKLP